MISYIESTLMPGESIRYQTHISVWSLAPQFLVGAVLLALSVASYGFFPAAMGLEPVVSALMALAFAACGLFLLAAQVTRFYTTEIAVTDKRVIAKVGLVSRETMEMLLEKVESLQVEQTVIGRLFDYGTVTISAAGEENARIYAVASPIGLRQSYYQAHDRIHSRLVTTVSADSA